MNSALSGKATPLEEVEEELVEGDALADEVAEEPAFEEDVETSDEFGAEVLAGELEAAESVVKRTEQPLRAKAAPTTRIATLLCMG